MAHAVEDSAQHVAGNGQLQGVAQEADLTLGKVNTGGGLEELNDSLVALDFKDLAAADFAGGELDFGKLVVSDAFNSGSYHQRAGYFFYGTIFFNHAASPPPITSSICAAMSSVILA